MHGVFTRIIDGPLPPMSDDQQHDEDGAELVFHGRVRAGERGRAIVALEYEVYREMAEMELRRLAQEAVARFPISSLHCLHRVGRVDVGDASLRVIIWSKHRSEALQAIEWFIAALKDRVPIWKWGVTAEGDRFPS